MHILLQIKFGCKVTNIFSNVQINLHICKKNSNFAAVIDYIK